jgi:molybdopterin converting factor small subunit
MKTIHLRYTTLLQEQRGLSEETVQTESLNAAVLFDELCKRHGFRYRCGMFKVIINDEMQSLSATLNDGDEVTFLPPIPGG